MKGDIFNFLSLTHQELSTYVDKLALSVVKYLVADGKKIACAESCTGGMLAQYITSISGASKVFECGVVSYSERIKSKLLGIPERLIAEKGVVSKDVALAMAKGVSELSGADMGIGITGLADPASIHEAQPAGTIFVSVVFGDKGITDDIAVYRFGSFTREKARLAAAGYALECTLQLLNADSMQNN